jgi:broad specificity phosphatase PhoE
MRSPAIPKCLLAAVALGCVAALPAAAEPTIFLVRHAERADLAPGGRPMMGADPDLSEAGRRRAAALATMLRDANITAIYVTEYKRTGQTAAPLAELLRLPVTTIGSEDTAALVDALGQRTGNVLVVGHSNTLPVIVRGLGIASPVRIGDDEYDYLFVVTMGPQRSLTILRYP